MEAVINPKTPEKFGNAIVFDVELLNGDTTSTTTIFNMKEVDFEEIVAYMIDAFKKMEKVKSITPSVGSIRGGNYSPVFLYNKTEFDRRHILENPILRNIYGLQ